MADAHVHEVDTITDIDDGRLYVGVDYDSVVVGNHRLGRLQCEYFARAFTAACWEAARCGIEQELEARDT